MINSKNLLILIVQNLVISLIAVSLSVVSILILKGQIEKITDAIVLNHKLENELKKRTELLSVIDNGAKIIGGNNYLINNAYLPSDNISPFINKLDSLVSISNIAQTYHFDTPVSSQVTGPYPLSTISFTNALTTDLTNLSVYLKSFENLPYFTKIESLNISSQDKQGWTGLSNITFKATLYTKTSQ